jgi:hypothetical protein
MEASYRLECKIMCKYVKSRAIIAKKNKNG